MYTAVIKKHPSTDDVVLVELPPDLLATIKSQVDAPPMWWPPNRKAWQIHVDAVEVLIRILTRTGVVLVDEREPDASVSTGPMRHRPLPECRNCQTPVRRGSQPAYCAGCGQPADLLELTVDEVTGARASSECFRCGRTQPGAFPFCTKCGATMPSREAMTVRAPRSTPARPQLEDPVAVGEAMSQLDLG